MDIRTGTTAGSASNRARLRHAKQHVDPEETVQPIGVPLWTRC